MEDHTPPENCSKPQRRLMRSFKRMAVWSVLLIVLQYVFIFPLDKYHMLSQMVLQKPVRTIVTISDELLSRELNANSLPNFQAVTNHWLAKGERLFHPIIVKAAAEHEIDPALIKAIIMAESGYNPKAISKRGAAGLMQLMPRTAEALGVEDIFNPEHNINGGVLYFKYLVELFGGDVKLALAAYNAGVRKVKLYQGIPPFKATRFYIQKVFKYYEHFREQPVSDEEKT